MKNNKINVNKIIIFLIISLVVVIGMGFLIYYIINDNYIDNVVFYLNGSPIIEIEQGEKWNDPFVIALYDDETIEREVVVSSNVNVSTPGSYEITYTIKKGFSKKVLKRVVNVKEHNDGFSLILKGKDTIYMKRGSKYADPGYNAYYNGLDVSGDVIITGQVNSDVLGEYILNYKVNNGIYSREKTRKVIVVDFNYGIDLKDKSDYVKENVIVFSSSDSNYDYVLLPDGTKKYDKSFSYNINENGTYVFVIYNKLGFYENKTFNIINIDKISPTGSCTLYMYDSYTEVVVNANDNFSIDKYEYNYGDKSSGKIRDNRYKYYDVINKAFVNVYDKVNNKATFECKIVDKSSIMPSGYNSYTFKDPETSRTMNYWLYIPKNVTKRNPVPLMVYLHGAGSQGTNINLVNDYAYPNFIKNGQEFPFMMIAPQINKDMNWTDTSTQKRVMNLINFIVNNYYVNSKKIILAGGSLGGGGAYSFTANYPKFFSCTVVGSGLYVSAYRKYASSLIYTPMWIFHGTNDGIDYNSVEDYANYINSLGGNVKFVGIKGAGHNVTETIQGFKNPELIEWMMKQERN